MARLDLAQLSYSPCVHVAHLQQAVESSYRIVRASQMLFLNYPGISRRDKLDVGTSQSGGCYERHIGA